MVRSRSEAQRPKAVTEQGSALGHCRKQLCRDGPSMGRGVPVSESCTLDSHSRQCLHLALQDGGRLPLGTTSLAEIEMSPKNPKP